MGDSSPELAFSFPGLQLFLQCKQVNGQTPPSYPDGLAGRGRAAARPTVSVAMETGAELAQANPIADFLGSSPMCYQP